MTHYQRSVVSYSLLPWLLQAILLTPSNETGLGKSPKARRAADALSQDQR